MFFSIRFHFGLPIAMALAAWCASSNTRAGVSQSDLFVAGKGGYHTYRIPALVTTTKGTLLAFCEGRKNGRGDSGAIDLLLRRSADGGTTWSPQQVVWHDGPNTCGNPCAVVDQQTGTIWLLLTWNRGDDRESRIIAQTSKDTRRVFVTSSHDEGLTWRPPQEITAEVKPKDWTWYATGPGNGIQLSRGPHRGRLVVPCDHVTGEKGTGTFFGLHGGAAGQHANGRKMSQSPAHAAYAHVILSDDHGKTWRLGGSAPQSGSDESAVVELNDGRLMLNMRTYDRARLRKVCLSRDGGATWQGGYDDPALVDPPCQGSILRYTWTQKGTVPFLRHPAAKIGTVPAGPGGKSRILFANPAARKRQNMTVRLSYDEGKTWPVARSLYAGPAAYGCMTTLPDGGIAIAFETGAKGPRERITLARFSLAWLSGGRDALP